MPSATLTRSFSRIARRPKPLPARYPMVLTILGATALGLATWAGIYFGPELARYIRMHRM